MTGSDLHQGWVGNLSDSEKQTDDMKKCFSCTEAAFSALFRASGPVSMCCVFLVWEDAHVL